MALAFRPSGWIPAARGPMSAAQIAADMELCANGPVHLTGAAVAPKKATMSIYRPPVPSHGLVHKAPVDAEMGCVALAEMWRACGQMVCAPFKTSEASEYASYLKELHAAATIIKMELVAKKELPARLIERLSTSKLNGTFKVRGLIESSILQAVTFDEVSELSLRCNPVDLRDLLGMFNELDRNGLLDLNSIEGFAPILLMENQQLFWDTADAQAGVQMQTDPFFSQIVVRKCFENFRGAEGADVSTHRPTGDPETFLERFSVFTEENQMRLKGIIGFYCYFQTCPDIRSNVKQLLKLYTLKLVRGIEIDSSTPEGRAVLHEAKSSLFESPEEYTRMRSIFKRVEPYIRNTDNPYDHYWGELMQALEMVFHT